MNTFVRMLTVAALLAVPVGAFAQATVDVRPPELAVAPWDLTAEARVILQNKEKTAITGATLMVFSNDGITATIDPAPPPRLQPNDSFAWRVPLNISAARVPGSLEIDVSFTLGGERLRRHLYQTLKLKGAEGAVVENPLEVTLSGSFDSVSESRPGRGYVVIVNKLDVPMTITAIAVQAPDRKSFGDELNFNEKAKDDDPPAKFASLVVPPSSSRSQFIELRASEAVATGKHRIVLAVDAEWTRHGRQQSRTVLVGQDVTLGVVFESEILKVFSIPSFLVLPGCLFLFTIQVLLKFKWGRDNRPTQWPELSSTSAEFWVIAITWSGIFAWLYARWPGVDFLSRYGATDLRNVWVSSIVLGIIVYSGMVWYNRVRNKKRVVASDDPIKTIEKMGMRGVSTVATKSEISVNGSTFTAFVVERSRDGQTAWAVPPIAVEFSADARALPAKQALITLVDAGSTTELGAALKQAKRDGFVAVKWNKRGSVNGPTSIAGSAIGKNLSEETMIEVS